MRHNLQYILQCEQRQIGAHVEQGAHVIHGPIPLQPLELAVRTGRQVSAVISAPIQPVWRSALFNSVRFGAGQPGSLS